MRKLVVDISKQQGHPERKRYVELTPEEVSARRAEEQRAEQKAKQKAERQAKKDRYEELLQTLTHKRIVHEQVLVEELDEYKQLRAELYGTNNVR